MRITSGRRRSSAADPEIAIRQIVSVNAELSTFVGHLALLLPISLCSHRARQSYVFGRPDDFAAVADSVHDHGDVSSAHPKFSPFYAIPSSPLKTSFLYRVFCGVQEVCPSRIRFFL